MTIDEADKIALAIGLADGGCGHCAQKIADELELAFPQFRFVDDASRDEMNRYGMRAVPAVEIT